MREKVLIGLTDEGFTFADIEFGKDSFYITFDTVEPVISSPERDLEEAQDLVEELSDDEVGHLLRQHSQISYDELPKFLYDCDGIELIYDISLFNHSFALNDDEEVFFNSVSVSSDMPDLSNSILFVPSQYIEYLEQAVRLSGKDLNDDEKAFISRFYSVTLEMEEQFEKYGYDWIERTARRLLKED